MANKAYNTDLFDKAAKFAIDAHHGTERRGKGYPYSIHLMEAAEIVASITNDPELLAAAMLHDVIEDTDVTEEEIRQEFGDRVASLVAGESDPVIEGKTEEETWKARKEFVIKRLAGEPKDNKIVALGDKLSNMRAIARDFDEVGDELWKIFHAPDPRLHEWHYRGLADALKELDDTAAYKEFVSLIDKTFSRAFKNI